jgi:NagD protein
VGEGVNYTLDQISSAIDMILEGSKLIATNLDPSPHIPGWTKPGIKATVAMLEEATGKKAFSVGKPSPVMLREARKQLGTRTAETVILGDTMDTDILGGTQMGYFTILTLTGVSQRKDIQKYAFEPSLIIESIAELTKDRIDLIKKNLPAPE